ncbi:MAG: hypothetical protein UZ21_OP11001000790 [Microgenomates bacterium OLB22]|nr:MAG: hypothetical protein UZ21_OP11001000790 [Microgenomates bacterium OLB22]
MIYYARSLKTKRKEKEMRNRLVIDVENGVADVTSFENLGEVPIIEANRPVAFWDLPEFFRRLRYRDAVLDFSRVASHTQPLPTLSEGDLVGMFTRSWEPRIIPQLRDGRLICVRNVPAGTVYVVEFPCGLRPIYEQFDSKSSVRRPMVAVPYVYLVICMKESGELFNDPHGISVFYSRTEAVDMDHQLYASNLPNVRDVQSVCLSKDTKAPDTKLSIKEKLDFWVDAFWNTIFSRSIDDEGVVSNFMYYASNVRGCPRSFAEWERVSTRTPRFFLGVPLVGLSQERRLLTGGSETDLTLSDVVLPARYRKPKKVMDLFKILGASLQAEKEKGAKK